MVLTKDIRRDAFQLTGPQAKRGYDWWWHSFTATEEESGEEKSFFLEFFLINPDAAKDRPTFGRLGETPSYLMVKAGSWGEDALQLHRFFSWKDIVLEKGVPFSIKADDCFFCETETKGSVTVSCVDARIHPEWMCDAGSIEWDLSIRKEIPFNVGYGASGPMRKLQLFQMFWHAEGMKTSYSGTITLNGKRYLVTPEKSYGYADKNWGKNFTSPWVWLSSNDLISRKTGETLKDSVFDIGGGCPKIGPVKLKRKLLSAFSYKGKGYEFNFSKFWTFCRTSFSAKETDTEIIWHVEQKTIRHRMVTDITCKKKDMLLINYEDPLGRKRHNRLWNGGNGVGTVSLYRGKKLIDTLDCAHVGCEYGEYSRW